MGNHSPVLANSVWCSNNSIISVTYSCILFPEGAGAGDVPRGEVSPASDMVLRSVWSLQAEKTKICN